MARDEVWGVGGEHSLNHFFLNARRLSEAQFCALLEIIIGAFGELTFFRKKGILKKNKVTDLN